MITNDKAELLLGLRALADYLEANPEIPVDPNVDVYIFPGGDEETRRAEVHRLAGLFGTQVCERSTTLGHHRTSLDFGPVHLTVVAIDDNSPYKR